MTGCVEGYQHKSQHDEVLESVLPETQPTGRTISTPEVDIIDETIDPGEGQGYISTDGVTN